MSGESLGCLCWRSPKLVTSASHANSLTANLPRQVTQQALQSYTTQSLTQIQLVAIIFNKITRQNTSCFCCMSHPYIHITLQTTLTKSLRLICKNTQKFYDCKLCRMDLFDSEKIHFEIFCQVLFTSLMISEILQGHHKHFYSFSWWLRGLEHYSFAWPHIHKYMHANNTFTLSGAGIAQKAVCLSLLTKWRTKVNMNMFYSCKS